MRSIAFINEKGGSLKTTLSVHAAAFFASKGKRVLLIDMDPQGQAGKSLGITPGQTGYSVMEFIETPMLNVEKCAQHTAIPNLWVLPTDKSLSRFPEIFSAHKKREWILSHRLAPTRDQNIPFDIYIFDTPPSLGLITTNIILAATEIVIPVPLTYLAMDGCAEMVRTIENIIDVYEKHDLAITKVVPTLYRKTKMADEILQTLKKVFGKKLSNTLITYNVKIDEAQSHGKTIWQYAPTNSGAQMMTELCQEICHPKQMRALTRSEISSEMNA